MGTGARTEIRPHWHTEACTSTQSIADRSEQPQGGHLQSPSAPLQMAAKYGPRASPEAGGKRSSWCGWSGGWGGWVGSLKTQQRGTDATRVELKWPQRRLRLRS